VTRGATVSVEPVTATLPEDPESVHSAAPLPSGAAVGQLLSAVAGGAAGAASVAGGALTHADDVVGDGDFAPELHAVSTMTADAAASESITRVVIPNKFTPSRYNHAVLSPHRSSRRST
jgi:hypothetical protein